MKRRVEYHPEAKLEIQTARDWYENKVRGLGLEFLLEVQNAESRIVQGPRSWPVYESGTRRFLVNRFPYAMVYLATEQKIQVVAISHCRRKPGYWKDRLSSE